MDQESAVPAGDEKNFLKMSWRELNKLDGVEAGPVTAEGIRRLRMASGASMREATGRVWDPLEFEARRAGVLHKPPR